MNAKPNETMRARRDKHLQRFEFIGWAGAVIALTCALPVMGAAASDRQALWHVVRACVANFQLTGAAFPCLKVDLSGGVQNGFVVLRPPFGKTDTILTPTRKVIGVEDTWLQTPSSPNYFLAAWNARELAPEGAETPSALAVNSSSSRSQDQLHIHIGCLVAGARLGLQAAAAKLPIGVWQRIEFVIPDADVWAYRTGSPNLAGFDPFRLAAQGLAVTTAERARLIMAVAAVRVDARDEFFVLASRADLGGSHPQVTAEDVVDPTCPKRANVSQPK